MEVPTTWPALTCASTYCAAPSRATTWCPAASTNTSSSGKPVVSMLFPEQVEHFPDVVYGAHSPEEFAALCRRALAETGDWAKNRRREHGAAAAWSARADEVTRILGTSGLY